MNEELTEEQIAEIARHEDDHAAFLAYWHALGGAAARGTTPYGWFAAGWAVQAARGHYVHGEVLTVEHGD